MIRYVFQLIRKYDRFILWIAIAANLTAAAAGIFPVIYPRLIIDGLQRQIEFTALVKLIFQFAVFTILFSFLAHYCQSMVYVRSMSLRFRVLIETGNLYTRAPYSLVEDPSFIDLSHQADRATADNNVGVEGILHTLTVLGASFLTVLWTSMMLFRFPVLLLLIVAAIAANAFLSIQKEKAIKQAEDRSVRPTRQWNHLNHVMQNEESYKDIVLYQYGNVFSKHLEKCRSEKTFYTQKIHSYQQSTLFVFEFLQVLAKMLVYSILGVRAMNGSLSLGEYTSYSLACFMLISSSAQMVKDLSYIYHQADIVRDHKKYVDQLEEANQKMFQPDSTTIDELRIDQVSFSYPAQDKHTIHHLSLSVSSKEKIAIVGLNGAGKTTLVTLLMGLYQPQSGHILINGKDTALCRQDDLFALFAPAFQETNLYAFTIAENISMRPLSMTDMDKVKRCCQMVGLSEKIERLPNGYLQHVTRVLDADGIQFSGGERQRLGLARALYKNAPILIFDEPTAAYDAVVESELYQTMEQLSKDKMVFFISHRLASTQFCDRIIYLDDGRIKECGSHEDLLHAEGEYAKLFQIQGAYYQGGNLQ